MRIWPVVLMCVAGCGRLGFDETGLVDDPSTPDAAIGDPADPAPAPVAYIATIAECINPRSPDPMFCATTNGNDQLVVDGEDGSTNDPWESYLQFELDARVAGRTVTRVRLVMTATDDDKADGPDGGAVWRVGAFDLAALRTRAPAKSGPAPLAASQGRVERDEVVEWELPIEIVADGAPVHLGVITESQTNGGVNYWNRTGVVPPRLVVDVE